MAAVVKKSMEYPPEVMMRAAETIPFKNSHPNLKYIADTRDEIYEPIRRNEERKQLARDRKLALAAPSNSAPRRNRRGSMQRSRTARAFFARPQEGCRHDLR
jgi:hypothetical protein